MNYEVFVIKKEPVLGSFILGGMVSLQFAITHSLRLVCVLAKAHLLVSLVVRITTFEPEDLTVALKG